MMYTPDLKCRSQIVVDIEGMLHTEQMEAGESLCDKVTDYLLVHMPLLEVTDVAPECRCPSYNHQATTSIVLCGTS